MDDEDFTEERVAIFDATIVLVGFELANGALFFGLLLEHFASKAVEAIEAIRTFGVLRWSTNEALEAWGALGVGENTIEVKRARGNGELRLLHASRADVEGCNIGGSEHRSVDSRRRARGRGGG